MPVNSQHQQHQQHQQQSTSSFTTAGAFSTFRSRNLSTASTASQDSGCGFTMEELVSSEISGPWLEDISPQYSQEAGVSNKPKIKILEPRDSRLRKMVQPMERVEVMGEEEDRLLVYEEERRLMILRQLEILTNKKITEN